MLAPPTLPTAKKEEHLTIAAPIAVEEPKTKVTPTSSEDDWEKADMEVQRVDDENKRQKTAKPTTTPVEKPEESRESSSLGGSWSQQDTEPSERSSVEPVEILEHPVIIVEEKEEKTPRVSMSENHEQTPTIFDTAISISEPRDESPEIAGHPNQNTSVVLNSTNSTLEAIATSTPKESKPEKRSSVSSQGTIGAERKKKDKSHEKMEKVNRKAAEKLAEREEASGNNSDSTLASKPEFVRGDARASYRECKKAYLAIWDRLNIMRTDPHHSEFRSSSKLANPLLAAAGLSRHHPAIRRESTGGRNDGRASVPLHHSQSFNENMYVENGGRRSRVSRLDPNGRPSSRHAPGYNSVNQMDPRMMYDQRGYMQQQGYRAGRYSAIGMPYDPRRPPSSHGVDPYNVYGQEPQETSSISESEEEEENGESDDEVRGYNMQQEQYYRGQGAPQHYQQSNQGDDDGKALYYCGVVHVNMDTWRRLKDKHGIPPEFYNLNPIEKAAFMFYTVVFKQPYRNVDAFHNRFNREFYKYVCAGDSNDDALFKICRSMQQQYIERQQEKKLADHNMKALLFSDDTDGQSEINSVYEESLNAYDIYNNGPLKFTCPHSFLHISTGGQIISIQPDQSISAVVFDDIKSVLKDIPTLQIKDAAMTFKGPLVPHQTAPHTVRLYITKQIENIKRSAVAQENPEANDVVESLLVWQLLETMVRQQGNITGPDIADLLGIMNVNIEAPPQPSSITPALNQFTHFLLGGHIDEAVESAMRNGLFADALVLTRRLFPNDERRIEQIESRFLQTRSLNNPVTTLVSVAKGENAPVLTNPPLDDHMSWRTHAAIILANLGERETALSTIHKLGQALAKRDYHCAADFCFLVCGVLGGKNPFEPELTPEGEEDYRRYISLVNSDIPDNEANPKCQYGFLLTDLHATEIFDYAFRLKPDRESLLARSVEYQTTRVKYAKLLANHGFNSDAYRYCTEIAREIWFHLPLFKVEDLLELCDLADSLYHKADVNPQETQWIHDLRATLEAGFVTRQQLETVTETVAEPVKVEEPPQNYEYQQQQAEQPEEPRQSQIQSALEAPIHTSKREPSPSPAPSAFTAPFEYTQPPLEHPPQYQQPYFNEEPIHVPPTPTGSVYQEQHAPNPESAFFYHQPEEQPSFPDDGFTTPPDFMDGPLTMASSPPSFPPVAEQTAPPPMEPTPTQQPQQNHHDVTQQHAPMNHKPEQQNNSQGWLKSIQSTVQKALPGQNPMNLPEDKTPAIVWDSTQNKYVGPGVEQEPVAPPPPVAAAAPVAPQGGGLRAARGVSRYAKVGLASSTTSQPPAGMMPQAPPTASFGFMPAPVDDDSEPFDPFSGQANPTIQQYTKMPSDE